MILITPKHFRGLIHKLGSLSGTIHVHITYDTGNAVLTFTRPNIKMCRCPIPSDVEFIEYTSCVAAVGLTSGLDTLDIYMNIGKDLYINKKHKHILQNIQVEKDTINTPSSILIDAPTIENEEEYSWKSSSVQKALK